MIGLERGTVILNEYSPEWEGLGKLHCKRITEALGQLAEGVEHVGSTSVLGLISKPIIDIAVGVQSLNNQIIESLEFAGYVYRPSEDRTEEMLFVQANGEWRSAHIHVVRYMGMEWRNYINFRDYLRAHTDVREQYAALKIELAKRFPLNRQGYMDGKAEFIKYALRKAMVWSYLGKHIDAKVDRPVGYLHTNGNKQLLYPINYGYIPGVLGGDDEELDVYFLGKDQPINEFSGKVIAIVHRADDVEDKLVACHEDLNFSAIEICKQINFQERYYNSTVQTCDGCWMMVSEGILL